jgi:L-histidine Nalpha-methyltransferase
LPGYYLARAEEAVVRATAERIAKLAAPATVIELGPASLEVTRPLLDAFRARGGLASYVGVDFCEQAVAETTRILADEHPELAVRSIVTDFQTHLGLPGYPATGAALVVSLGATFGGMYPAQRAAYLTAVRARLSAGDALLLGCGLVKDPSVLLTAYEDRLGLTAALNKNILTVLNARLGADFDRDAFDHVAEWVPGAGRIELRLRAAARQQVLIPGSGPTASFAAHEEVCTEIATRFRRDGLEAELAAADLAMRAWWTDPDESFAISLAVPQ